MSGSEAGNRLSDAGPFRRGPPVQSDLGHVGSGDAGLVDLTIASPPASARGGRPRPSDARRSSLLDRLLHGPAEMTGRRQAHALNSDCRPGARWSGPDPPSVVTRTDSASWANSVRGDTAVVGGEENERAALDLDPSDPDGTDPVDGARHEHRVSRPRAPIGSG